MHIRLHMHLLNHASWFVHKLKAFSSDFRAICKTHGLSPHDFSFTAWNNTQTLMRTPET